MTAQAALTLLERRDFGTRRTRDAWTPSGGADALTRFAAGAPNLIGRAKVAAAGAGDRLSRGTTGSTTACVRPCAAAATVRRATAARASAGLSRGARGATSSACATAARCRITCGPRGHLPVGPGGAGGLRAGVAGGRDRGGAAATVSLHLANDMPVVGATNHEQQAPTQTPDPQHPDLPFTSPSTPAQRNGSTGAESNARWLRNYLKSLQAATCSAWNDPFSVLTLQSRVRCHACQHRQSVRRETS